MADDQSPDPLWGSLQQEARNVASQFIPESPKNDPITKAGRGEIPMGQALRQQASEMFAGKGYDPSAAAEMAAYSTPVVGEALSARDAYNAARQGDWLSSALSAVGTVPLLGGIFLPAKREQIMAAEALEREGAHPNDILKQTGAHRNVEGDWTREISDAPSRITPEAQHDLKQYEAAEGTARAMLKHPELYKEVPSLEQYYLQYELEPKYITKEHPNYLPEWENAAVRMEKMGSSPEEIFAHLGMSRGPNGEWIQKNLPQGWHWGDFKETRTSASNLEDIRSSQLHEFQHAADQAAGRAHGANPETYYKLLSQLPSHEVIMQGERARVSGSRTAPDIMDYKDNYEGYLRHLADDLYIRDVSEARARAVEARRNLTQEQLSERHPFEDMDVPPEQQIIPKRADGGDVSNDPLSANLARVGNIPTQDIPTIEPAPLIPRSLSEGVTNRAQNLWDEFKQSRLSGQIAAGLGATLDPMAAIPGANAGLVADELRAMYHSRLGTRELPSDYDLYKYYNAENAARERFARENPETAQTIGATMEAGLSHPSGMGHVPPAGEAAIENARTFVKENAPGPNQLSAGISRREQPNPSAERSIDPLGYYSHALETAKSLPQTKGTPEQMLSMLKKGGVKDAEIQATNLPQFLEGKQSVTRDELVNHLTDNRIGLNKVVREPISGFDNLTSREPTQWHRYSLDPANPTYRETVLHLGVPEENVARAQELAQRETELFDLTHNLRVRGDTTGELERANEELYRISDELGKLNKSVFHSGHFSEPNITGHLMTSVVKDKNGRNVFNVDQIQSDWGQKLRESGVWDEAKIAKLEAELGRANEESRRIEDEAGRFIETVPDRERNTAAYHLNNSNPFYEVPYGPRGDVETLANYGEGSIQRKAREFHYALKDAIEDENRIEAELSTAKQSPSGHPLVNTTDQWTNTTLRHALRQAVESGADAISIPSGKTVLSYNPGGEHGMEEFYNRIVPKNLGNILKKIDPSAAKSEFHNQLVTPSKGAAGQGFTVFPLTDKIKKSVMEQGQPLFARGGSISRQDGGATAADIPTIEPAPLIPKSLSNLMPDLNRNVAGTPYFGGTLNPTVTDTGPEALFYAVPYLGVTKMAAKLPSVAKTFEQTEEAGRLPGIAQNIYNQISALPDDVRDRLLQYISTPEKKETSRLTPGRFETHAEADGGPVTHKDSFQDAELPDRMEILKSLYPDMIPSSGSFVPKGGLKPDNDPVAFSALAHSLQYTVPPDARESIYIEDRRYTHPSMPTSDLGMYDFPTTNALSRPKPTLPFVAAGVQGMSGTQSGPSVTRNPWTANTAEGWDAQVIPTQARGGAISSKTLAMLAKLKAGAKKRA